MTRSTIETIDYDASPHYLVRIVAFRIAMDAPRESNARNDAPHTAIHNRHGGWQAWTRGNVHTHARQPLFGEHSEKKWRQCRANLLGVYGLCARPPHLKASV